LNLIGFKPFALLPLLMANWVFLVIGDPLRFGLEVVFEEDLDLFLVGARPSSTSPP
jgi:hypothetical protein